MMLTLSGGAARASAAGALPGRRASTVAPVRGFLAREGPAPGAGGALLTGLFRCEVAP